MATVTSRFVTSGMHCSSCSMLIDMTLADLEGVIETKTDHGAGISTVTYDDEILTPAGVVAAILSVGYEAELQS